MILTFEERLANAVKEMSNGTFRGLSRAASPFSPPIGGFNGIHQSLEDIKGVPFIVVASDGTGDFTSIKTAIEADTDTLSGEGGRYIWVKPGTYDDSAAGFVDLGGRNVQVFAPTADMTPYTGTTTAIQSWRVAGITATGGSGFGRFEGIAIQLVGTAARLFEATAQACAVQFVRCILESGGGALQSMVRTAALTQAVFTDCAVSTAVFSGATSYGGQLRFFNCTQTNFSPAGGAATVTGNPTIRVIGGDLTWPASLVMNGTSGTATGAFVLHGVEILSGSRNLTLDDIGMVEINDCYNRGANSGSTIWQFTTNVAGASRPNFSLQGNAVRDIDLEFIDASGSAENDNASVRVSGTYRSILMEISRAEVDAVLDESGASGAVVFLRDAANTESCNFQIAIRSSTAGEQAWNLAGANHILSLSGYAEATVASVPAPAAPPSVAVNGTHVFTITN